MPALKGNHEGRPYIRLKTPLYVELQVLPVFRGYRENGAPPALGCQTVANSHSRSSDPLFGALS